MNKINLLGIQYDDKSSYLKGARLAPPIIKEKIWSTSSNTFSENLIDINTYLNDVGNKEISNYFDIESIVANQFDNDNKIIILGGDHSITYPILKAFYNYYGSFDVLHIDAHPDLYDSLDGDKYSHACPFTRIMEDNLIDNLIQVGIRTWTEHQREQANKFKIPINDMKSIDFSEILNIENDVYISLDMDVFDPAFAPGVSHHEPGGFTSREVITLIQNINTRIIGADIVEYNPERDVQGITAALAAKMVKEISSKMIENG
jgi:agmatinase